MSVEKNIRTVKDFFAAIGRGDREALLALVVPNAAFVRILPVLDGRQSALPA